MFPQATTTFGVEIEFMTPCPFSKTQWANLDPCGVARLGVAEEMAKRTSLPVACQCYHGPGQRCPICDGVSQNDMRGDLRILSSGELPRATSSPSRYFVFQEEFLGGCEPISLDRNWPGVEMSTPSFRYGELRAGLPSIKTAISTLRAMPLRLSADSSCGLHVHVGIDDGMTLLTAKKTVALVMVLEDHLLFPLCARSRQWNPSTAAISSRSHAAAGRHYPPVEAVGPGRLQPIADYLPQWTILAPAGWNHNKPRDIWHTLERVWTARSLQDLSVKLCFERYTRAGLAIALRDAFGKSQAHIHRGSLENTPSTIEFRYAQMSFDMQFIQNWIELVSRIVEIAQLEANEYQQCFNAILNELRDANMESEEPAWQRLMENVLELEHQVPAWKLQLAMYGQGKEIAHLSDDLILERDLDAH